MHHRNYRAWLAGIADRLDKGAVEYGDKSYGLPFAELRHEIDQEFQDIVGWLFIVRAKTMERIDAIERRCGFTAAAAEDDCC
jgi:hypothetical protein